MNKNGFLEIMNFIEKETDIPLLEKDIKEWIKKDEKNKVIYEIYLIASKNR